MVSKFSYRILYPLGLLIFILALLAYFVQLILTKQVTASSGIFALMGLFTAIAIWLCFGELRTKAINVWIADEQIAVSKYLGLGGRKYYPFTGFSGFETAQLTSNSGSYEYLYLMIADRKAVKLSEFYHSNYDDLKAVVMQHLENLGEKEFEFWQEMKEIFI